MSAVDYDPNEDKPLLDPTDPTGNRSICKNRDEVDAMLAAAEIDPRLPKIIMLRKLGKPYREICATVGVEMNHMKCYRLLHSVTPKLLRECGLRL